MRLFVIILLFKLCATFPKDEQISVEIQEPKIEDVVYEPEDVSVLKQAEIDANETSKNPEEFKEEPFISGRVSYSGSQVWKVIVDTDSKRALIRDLNKDKEISMWGGNATSLDILVKPIAQRAVTEQFQAFGINYEIMIQDLQRAIDEENPPILEDAEDLQDRKGHRLTWQAYHRLTDIYGYLDYLTASYPSLCSVRTVGSSVEGRPLRLLKISNGNPSNKAVWMDGGIHAREWISPATVTYIANYLVENYESLDPALKNIDWHILAVVNPDGYEYSHTTDRLWRKNRARSGSCAGTDLNRNFGYRWGGKGSGKNPCQEIYGGVGPFSEPETQAIRNYITSQPNKSAWKAYISFHSYGQYILYPWGYDTVVPPDYQDLQTVGNKAANAMRTIAGAYYKVGSAARLLYPASGGSDDWAKGGVGMKYAFTIELRDSGRYGFVLPASYINPTAREALAAVQVIAEAVSVA